MMKIENGKKYIVRCETAGVFFGDIADVDGSTVHMKNVRKLWYWAGASAVEQLAKDGTKQPSDCKFTVTVQEMIVTGANQIIPCTKEAALSLSAVREWKQ